MIALMLKALALWGVLDSIWMALKPGDWARFWDHWIGRLGRGSWFSRFAAAAQLAISAYLLFSGWRGKSRGGLLGRLVGLRLLSR